MHRILLKGKRKVPHFLGSSQRRQKQREKGEGKREGERERERERENGYLNTAQCTLFNLTNLAIEVQT